MPWLLSCGLGLAGGEHRPLEVPYLVGVFRYFFRFCCLGLFEVWGRILLGFFRGCNIFPLLLFLFLSSACVLVVLCFLSFYVFCPVYVTYFWRLAVRREGGATVLLLMRWLVASRPYYVQFIYCVGPGAKYCVVLVVWICCVCSD